MTILPRYKLYVKKAHSDLNVAQRELTFDNPELEIVCFHLQQFVEKYLKAFLLFNNINIRKTHNLVYLLNECINLEITFQQFSNTKIIELNECGVEIRYDDIIEIEPDFISEVLGSILELKSIIDAKLNI